MGIRQVSLCTEAAASTGASDRRNKTTWIVLSHKLFDLSHTQTPDFLFHGPVLRVGRSA